jgi:Nuclease-related domain
MLIKDRDPAEKAVAQLTDLLSLPLSSTKKFLIERELKRLNPNGNVARTAFHFINFYCANCPDWAIIHDLKIESNGLAAHIDHILINKFLDFHLFESRNYNDNLKITADGEFLVFDGSCYQSIDSPLEENKRRAQVLTDLLVENSILPKRLGISLKPKIASYVLVCPGANVLRPPESVCDTSSVVTADYLTKTLLRQLERLKKTFERIKSLPKSFKQDTLAKVAAKLAAMNKPDRVDYRRIFCLEDINVTPAPAASSQDAVAACDYAI